MPQFTSSPALRARTFDLQDIQRQSLDNQLRQSELQQAQNPQADPRLDLAREKFEFSQDKDERAQALQRVKVLGQYAGAAARASGVQRVMIHGEAVKYAQDNGIATDNWRDPSDPDYVAWAQAQQARAGEAEKQAGGFTLSEGQTRYGPGGQEIASRPAAPDGGGRTALQKDVPYIAKLLGISQKEALALKIESKGKGYDDYLRGIAGRYVSFGERPERAYEKAKQVADLVYGRMAREPPEASPDSNEGRDYLEDILGFFGGGETGSAKSKKGAAIMGSRKNPHKPKTQADFNGIKSGEIYRDPDDQKLYRKP